MYPAKPAILMSDRLRAQQLVHLSYLPHLHTQHVLLAVLLQRTKTALFQPHDYERTVSLSSRNRFGDLYGGLW